MVIMYSFVLDILKDPEKSFKSSSKSGQKVGGKKKKELESFAPDNRGLGRFQMC